MAAIGANPAHGLGHGPIGALVNAWSALALAGSFELLMTLIRTEARIHTARVPSVDMSHPGKVDHDAQLALTETPSLEHTVLMWHKAGHSQRAIARELNIDRRRVRRILNEAA